MATYTTNYNLKKPASSDSVSIADINDNMDAIDTQMKALADADVVSMGTADVLPSAADKNGFWAVRSTTNSLSGADANPFLQYHSSKTNFRIICTVYSATWLQQIATDYYSDNVFVRRYNNGTWEDWKHIAFNTTLVLSIATSAWSNKTANITATGVTASNTVIVSPAPASIDAWGEAGMKCTAQASNQLTFTCEEVPTAAISVNVVILG